MESRIFPPHSWENPKDHWFFAIKNPWYSNLLRIQNFVVLAAHQFLNKNGLLHMIAPVTTGAISSPIGVGSDSLPVSILLNNKKTYLADSMQFALEYGCRMAPLGVYYIMQCFRGEEPDATHLNQFCHIEFEIPGDLDKTMDLSWKLIQAISKSLIDNCSSEIISAVGTLDHLKAVFNLSFPPQTKFSEAVNFVGKDGYINVSDNARALTKNGEKQISKAYAKADALWITHMDSLSVPFYQACEPDLKASLTADLLLCGREVVGSGHRHTDANDVVAALKAHQVNPDDYEWYIRMKEGFPISTSGMGLGLERFLMWVLKCDDIRDIPLVSRIPTEVSVP